MTEVKEKTTVTELPITARRPFEEHPYKVVDNEEMASLVESYIPKENSRPLLYARWIAESMRSYRDIVACTLVRNSVLLLSPLLSRSLAERKQVSLWWKPISTEIIHSHLRKRLLIK